jgi:hypothetical protein
MASAVDAAKRELVKLLRSLALVYNLVSSLTRDAPDADVVKFFNQACRKTHPDKGGKLEHQKALNAARDKWEAAAKDAKGTHGGGKRTKPDDPGGKRRKPDDPAGTLDAQRRAETGFRFQSLGVLLTYQKFADTGPWDAFLEFVRGLLEHWGVRFWSATMETNHDGSRHLHLMLQFYKAGERNSQTFSFQGVRPNAQPNDLLGEGFCKNKLQLSLDRAFFYVWADRVGTARNDGGDPLVAGNYEPAWTKAKFTYSVAGSFLDKLFKAHKLDFDTYDGYVHLARDGVPYRSRNLQACRERAQQQETEREVQERIKRIRSNPSLYQPFKPVPEALEWLESFKKDAMRFSLLVVHAPSYTGKTEWANSLFKKPFELKIGSAMLFPEKMRAFDRKKFDGLVLDDVRDIAFLNEHQEKLQGKYTGPVEFGSTAGGTCAYWRDLYGVPVVVTVNDTTKNLHWLAQGAHDFCGKRENILYLRFSGRPGEAPPGEAPAPHVALS